MRGPLLLAAALVATASAAGASAAAQPSPPAGAAAAATATATLVPERPIMVLGADQTLALTIEIHGDDAVTYAPDRAIASVGTLREIVPAGPHRFTARYLAPPTRFPQVALLVVDLVGGGRRVRAAAQLALHAAAEVPFLTSANASVTLQVGERTFGPARADGAGHVKIPIVVPPGLRAGLARAVDRFGNARETSVDLQPTPFDRLLIVAVPEAEVGSFAEISVFGVDARGAPLGKGAVTLRSSGGMVHPLGTGTPGEERFLIEAPPRVAAGWLALTATTVEAAADQPPARAEVSIPLVPGPPQRLILTSSNDRLVIGDGESAVVAMSARDRLDNPAPCAGAVALVDHRPVPVELSADGEAIIRVPAPDRYDGARRELEVEASLGRARATTRIRLVAGPAVRIAAAVSAPRLVADGLRSVDVRVDAYDKHGTPAGLYSLHWQTGRGRLGPVQTPREGSYVAPFTPIRAHERHTELLVITADPPAGATTAFTVEPPRPRLVLTARVGLFSNLGSVAGPAASIEALTGLPGHEAAWTAGLVAGYLRSDMTTGSGSVQATRLQIDQLPILVVLRYRLPLPVGADVTVGGGAGLSLARATLTAPPSDAAMAVQGAARVPAFEVRADVAFPLAPGGLVVGLHYLWIDLGHISSNDEVSGNSAGLVGDIGFRMTW
jgi:hypothetical protein